MSWLKNEKWRATLVAAIPCILLYLILSRNTGSVIALGDPDRFFHLALARETVEAGRWILKQVPQVSGLGWGLAFPDKEFLFHFINRWLYAWGGEAGVLTIIPLAASAIILSLTLLAGRFVKPWAAGLIVLLAFVLDPYMTLRMSMLRPHLLAILFFCGMLHAILSRSPLAAWIFGALYSWSYHSFYVPLLVLGVYYASDLKWRSPRLRVLVWGALGLLTGLVLHPHFPWNFWMSFRHAVIALLEADQAKLDFGVELFPWSTEKFLRLYLPFFYILLVSPLIVVLGMQKPREFLRRSDFLWLWAAALLFLALGAQNPRAIEYAIPLGLALVAVMGQSLGQSRRRSLVFFAGLLLVSAPRGIAAARIYFAERPADSDSARIESLVSTFRALPAKAGDSAEPEHVFNVEWDQSPYIYYARPDFRFLDILDPSFLESRDQRLHSVRWTLRRGEVPDPWGVVKSLTPSRYLLSRYLSLNAALNLDPHFRRISPRVGEITEGRESLYELLPSRDEHFVLDWSANAALLSGSSKDADALSPADASARRLLPVVSWHEHPQREAAGIEVAPVKSAYLDLRYGFAVTALGLPAANERSGDGVTCVLAEPSPADRARQQGRKIVALGGGRSLRVWINGKRFFRSVAVRDSVSLIDRLVELDRPLLASDRVQVLVCSRDSSPTLGLAMSFWTEQELQARCAERGWKPAEALGDSRNWPRIGDYRETCLGTIIRRR